MTTTPLLVVTCVLLCAPVASGAVSAFADLSIDEMKEVITYLHQSSLPIVEVHSARMDQASIFMVEAMRPVKAEALAYLDRGGPAPERAARVVLQRGDLTPPQMEEYKVSPIPNPTKHEIIKNPKWRDPIPYTARSIDILPQAEPMEAAVVREMTKINHILLEITEGFGYVNCSNKCLQWIPGVPPHVTAGHHKGTVYLFRNIEGRYLHPIGVQFVLNMDSLNTDDWGVEYIWFQGVEYNTFEEVVQARRQDSLNMVKVPDPENADNKMLMSSLNFRGDPRPATPKRGPMPVMPDGNRFEVKDRQIKWMGWDLEFSMLTSSGIQVNNVKFLNQRIAYEISLQDLGVFYSGGSPMIDHTTYYDTFTIIGLQTSQMFPGIDCPDYAEFFHFVHLFKGKPHLFPNGACVFELNKGIPLRRHYENDHAGNYEYYQGIPDNVLVFRQILAVNNYNYIIDFMFHQGGQIEGKVSLTGYIVNTFYTGPEMNKYGNVVSEPTSIGNIHHHFIGIKADLDILGEENRFETMDIKLEEIPDKINKGEKLLNRYFEHNLKMTEREAAYQFNFSTPKYLVIYNDKKENKFKNKRGYRIYSEGMSKVLLPREYRGFRGRAWTEYQVAMTKQHDNEQSSSSIYTQMEMYDPVVSFEDYINDDENIVDEDLVAWITLGTHHIPHSEDVPIVNTPAVQLTFFLLPYNYFDEDPSLASRDNVRITPDKNRKDGNHYQYSGVSGDGACPQQEPAESTCKTSGGTATFSMMSLVMAMVLAAFSWY